MVYIPLRFFTIREISLFIISVCLLRIDAAVTSLDNNNLDHVLQGSQVVFVNFYADWCRFSQMLKPVFEEASEGFHDPARVTFASVDCDRNPDIAAKYQVSKYPTLKMFRFGEQAKREYRGQRSKEALASFIEKQIIPPYLEFTSREDLDARIDNTKRNIIAYFPMNAGPAWDNLVKVSSNLREDCAFWVGHGPNFAQQTMGGENVAFKEPAGEEQLFSGHMSDYDYLRQWVMDKCIPLVREITFENAEELTEEGIPFLILFRRVDDERTTKIFTEEVARQLSDQKTSINALFADGVKFAHPLHHLGKSEADLPVLAIDSFRHMYVFPDVSKLQVPGKLREFVLDLHSGKLHREFHHGPDPTDTPTAQPPSIERGPDGQPVIVDRPAPPSGPKSTGPPESTFKKLKPNSNRYTLLKEEL